MGAPNGRQDISELHRASVALSMSWPARAWAREQPLKGWIKAVLFVLADAHNAKTGQCNPRVESIGECLGISRKTVGICLRGLIALGLVIRRRRFRQPTSYTLNVGINASSNWQHVFSNIRHRPRMTEQELGAQLLRSSEWAPQDQHLGTRVPGIKPRNHLDVAADAPPRRDGGRDAPLPDPKLQASPPVAARERAVDGAHTHDDEFDT